MYVMKRMQNNGGLNVRLGNIGPLVEPECHVLIYAVAYLT